MKKFKRHWETPWENKYTQIERKKRSRLDRTFSKYS